MLAGVQELVNGRLWQFCRFVHGVRQVLVPKFILKAAQTHDLASVPAAFNIGSHGWALARRMATSRRMVSMASGTSLSLIEGPLVS